MNGDSKMDATEQTLGYMVFDESMNDKDQEDDDLDDLEEDELEEDDDWGYKD